MAGGVRVLSAMRSAVAPRGGGLSRLALQDLAAPVLQAAIFRAGLMAHDVDEVVLGNALGAGGNPARVAALAAGLPERVAGLTLDRQCCGGLDAVVVAAGMIAAGQAEVVVAGGVESYSRRPLRLRTDPDGGAPIPYDRPPFTPWPERDPEMDVAADILGQEHGLSRAAQDAWAVASHRKALAADFGDEIVPVAGLKRDAFTRALSSKIAARAPVLSGTITAANAAVAADGAAALVLVSQRVADRLGRPGLRYLGGLTRGARPDQPGSAPVAAITTLLERHRLRATDLSVAEIMEAYAVQAIACMQGAGIDPGIVNLGGGGLARGHPVGASGAINAVRLVHELGARNDYAGHGGIGLAAIAAAGGLGTAVLLAR
ncbi:acetyl-CoA acetyltransferase [Thioclava sp. SK-1]|nr:thiolase family protein [Thioclava sp. SK-1]OCX65603.1 acetyl-CoA acetyltransferase [Thioclava sp. SK-1]